MNLCQLIAHAAQTHADRIAVIDDQREAAPSRDGVSVTYRQLVERIETARRELAAAGVERAQRIGLLADNSIDYIVASFAILAAGAAISPISTDLSPDERRAIAERVNLNAIIHDPAEQLELADEATTGDGQPLSCGMRLRWLDREAKAPAGFAAINPAFLRFTSGTTGDSKGVVLSHETIAERIAAANRALRIGPQDTVLWVLSMAYHFTVSIVSYLANGATIVLGRTFPPGAALEACRRHRVTILYASPMQYRLMVASSSPSSSVSSTLASLHHASASALFGGESGQSGPSGQSGQRSQPPDISASPRPSSAASPLAHVRLAIATTAPLPPAVAESFHAKFGIALTECYGIIEAGLPFINLDAPWEKRGSVGRALPGYEARLAGDSAAPSLSSLPPGEVGEICLRGPGFLDAYYAPWRPRAEVFRDGWFHTGDLGCFDEDGFLRIVGRKKEIINVGGMKVFPAEVERALDAYPGVLESRVSGQPHPQLGEAPCAMVVTRPNVKVDVEDLLRHCSEHLASYETPVRIEFVNAIPRTASGKILRW